MSEPKIYTGNILNSVSQLSGSYVNGSSNLDYLFDRGDKNKWGTTGSNSDALAVDMRISTIVGTSVSMIMIKKTNLHTDATGISVHYFNGSIYTPFLSQTKTVIGTLGDSTQIFTFPSQVISYTQGVMVYMVSTGFNLEKKAGEVIVANLIYSAPDFSTYDPKWRERTKEIVLGDGSVHRVSVKDAAGRLGKYEAATKWSYLTKSERDSLKAIKESGQPFLFQPESETVPDEIYYVHWANAWDEKYMSSYKGSGYEVVMNVKEI